MRETPFAPQPQLHARQTQEADAARADIVARLERLTKRVRTSTTTDIAKLDAAYSEVVTLAHALKAILA